MESYLNLLPKELLREIGLYINTDDLKVLSQLSDNLGLFEDEIFWIRYLSLRGVPTIPRYSIEDHYKILYNIFSNQTPYSYYYKTSQWEFFSIKRSSLLRLPSNLGINVNKLIQLGDVIDLSEYTFVKTGQYSYDVVILDDYWDEVKDNSIYIKYDVKRKGDYIILDHYDFTEEQFELLLRYIYYLP